MAYKNTFTKKFKVYYNQRLDDSFDDHRGWFEKYGVCDYLPSNKICILIILGFIETFYLILKGLFQVSFHNCGNNPRI